MNSMIRGAASGRQVVTGEARPQQAATEPPTTPAEPQQAATPPGNAYVTSQRRAPSINDLIRYQKGMLELAQARQDADKLRLAEISKETAPVFEQIKALQEQVAPLVAEANMIGNREGQHRDRKNTARNRLEKLLAERGDMLTKQAGGPVRSLWQRQAN